jgi:hypothetical protein
VSPPERETGPVAGTGNQQDAKSFAQSNGYRRQATESQQVNWWSVYELVTPVIDEVGDFPLLGTPPWCSLADTDPAKWAALLDAAMHHALRVELNQEARAEASKAVSAAVDWSAVGREIRTRAEFYAAKPWLRRAVS